MPGRQPGWAARRSVGWTPWRVRSPRLRGSRAFVARPANEPPAARHRPTAAGTSAHRRGRTVRSSTAGLAAEEAGGPSTAPRGGTGQVTISPVRASAPPSRSASGPRAGEPTASSSTSMSASSPSPAYASATTRSLPSLCSRSAVPRSAAWSRRTRPESGSARGRCRASGRTSGSPRRCGRWGSRTRRRRARGWWRATGWLGRRRMTRSFIERVSQVCECESRRARSPEEELRRRRPMPLRTPLHLSAARRAVPRPYPPTRRARLPAPCAVRTGLAPVGSPRRPAATIRAPAGTRSRRPHVRT